MADQELKSKQERDRARLLEIHTAAGNMSSMVKGMVGPTISLTIALMASVLQRLEALEAAQQGGQHG